MYNYTFWMAARVDLAYNQTTEVKKLQVGLVLYYFIPLTFQRSFFCSLQCSLIGLIFIKHHRADLFCEINCEQYAAPENAAPRYASPAPQFTSPAPQYASPAPQYAAPAVPIGVPWSTGLFDCHEDEPIALMTSFLPCVTFGQIAEILDQGQMTCFLGSFIYALMMPALCSQWVMGSKYRKVLRQKYNLVEAPYEDVVSHIFCPCCSLCQEFRELERRGLNPALGWNGILAQQQQPGSGIGPQVVPTHQTMNH
uniref:Protein PLANT CADMIUM RESISTANCE 8 n=1 Tax=Kalanchoe fedtschenkoi TaxID=63787 RepID=A0A7N1A7F7_KALFE